MATRHFLAEDSGVGPGFFGGAERQDLKLATRLLVAEQAVTEVLAVLRQLSEHVGD